MRMKTIIILTTLLAAVLFTGCKTVMPSLFQDDYFVSPRDNGLKRLKLAAGSQAELFYKAFPHLPDVARAHSEHQITATGGFS